MDKQQLDYLDEMFRQGRHPSYETAHLAGKFPRLKPAELVELVEYWRYNRISRLSHVSCFYENGFKYAERIQAEDRIHRIGQDQRCLYIDLVAVKSIDERIQQALSKKANVVEAFRRQVQVVRAKKGDVKELVRDL